MKIMDGYFILLWEASIGGLVNGGARHRLSDAGDPRGRGAQSHIISATKIIITQIHAPLLESLRFAGFDALAERKRREAAEGGGDLFFRFWEPRGGHHEPEKSQTAAGYRGRGFSVDVGLNNCFIFAPKLQREAGIAGWWHPTLSQSTPSPPTPP